MRMRTWIAALAAVCAICTSANAQANDTMPSKADALAGQKEMRRRGGNCMNSQVYSPAMRESRLPRDIGNTPAITPRIRQKFGKLVCYTVAGDGIWAADDQTVYYVSGDGKTVKSYDRSHGLLDATVQDIAVVGDNVWLATLSGLARLDAKANKIKAVPAVTFTTGEFVKHEKNTWLITNAGIWRLGAGAKTWAKLPDFPGRKRLADRIASGFWWYRWVDKEIRPVTDAFATEDGLYLLHGRVLYRYDGKWSVVVRNAWRAMPQGRTVWALCTKGVYHYDAVKNAGVLHTYGKGPALGRPVAMAATDAAFFIASHGTYNAKAKKFGGFTGGGISRFDAATGKWSVTGKIGGVNIHFVDSLQVSGGDVLAGVMLYDKPIRRGAHPGMAHVKRWTPHPSGLGLARLHDGKWTMLKREGLKTQKLWMAPQSVRVYAGVMGPQHIDRMCRIGDRIWGAYRVFPEKWYAGYFISGGCLARKVDGKWEAAFDVRTDELGLAGEYPGLLEMSRSHGSVYLGEGYLRILGVEQVAGRCWLISQAGLYMYDAEKDRFAGVVKQADRLYNRASCAAPGKDAVWFGGDGGTISRLDRKTGQLELVGRVPGRTIAAIHADGNRVMVRTTPGKVTLPATLRDTPKLPAADTLFFDGKQWRPSTMMVNVTKTLYTCNFKGEHSHKAKRQVNYLMHGKKRIAFIKGVYRPKVLAEDPVGKKLWLTSWSGVFSVPLPEAP
jgi:hypothetical protein